MSVRMACVLAFVVAVSGMALAQTELELAAAGLPKYPAAAVDARAAGVVKVSFTLPANGGEPTSVAIESGAPLFNTTVLDNLKTWRFANPAAVERKFVTTFEFRLSGKTVPAGAARKTRVTFESFDRVEVVTDVFEAVVNKNY